MLNPVTDVIVADELIKSALREDITSEDVSTNAIFKERTEGRVQLIAKAEGVICGLPVFRRVFELLDPQTSSTSKRAKPLKKVCSSRRLRATYACFYRASARRLTICRE